MGLLEKLENAINFLLIKLGELLVRMVPSKVKVFFAKISGWISFLITNFKRLPGLAKTHGLKTVQNGKAAVLGYDYKTKFKETLKKAQARQAKSSGAMKNFFMTPVYLMAEWLQGLTAAQSILLLSFTAGSILSVIGVFSSGNRIASKIMKTDRAPANIVEVDEYNRPAYYKKQTKHFDLTALRLPVFVAQINEVRPIDVDFTATTSNRNSRIYLEKNEFRLRDHLILTVEPMVAAFPLEEEGKQIIREKILMELNEFLKENEVEGHIVELKLTYILAN